MSCVFCAIVAGQAPAIRIYEDDGYLAFLDIRPFTRGHTLVVPKQHSVDLTDTAPETLAGMVTIGQRIAKAARATELADATNIGINDGRAAFQSVFHIHLHMLPRRNGDKLSVAKGLLLRRDPDRESTGRILRDALAEMDADAANTERMALPWIEKVLPPVLRLHDGVYQKTNGRIGHRILGVPNLLLHTVGAKTGQARTTHSRMPATAMRTSSSPRKVATRKRPAGITT